MLQFIYAPSCIAQSKRRRASLFSAGKYAKLRDEHGDNFVTLPKRQRIHRERQDELSDLLLMDSECCICPRPGTLAQAHSHSDAHGTRPAPAEWLARRLVYLGTLVCPANSHKKRGLAADALRILADEEFALRGKLIDAFRRLIANPANPPELNAYLVHFLGQIEAQDVLRPVIEAAFAENRIDTEIIELSDMEWMEDDEDEWKADDA